jgi:N,N'-diacetyllegionaminate synthase
MSESGGMRIGSRAIGPDQPVMVIAEIGVNHDGFVGKALDLVQHASNAGADAVKLQVFRAERLMHGSSGFAEYQKRQSLDPTPTDMLRRYELSADELRLIVAKTRELGMIPLATPFSPEDVALISELNLDAIKIASPDLVNHPLLEAAATCRMPLIVSTGAATLKEISRACDWLDSWKSQFALLHCVSSYPTEIGDANLGWIARLSEQFRVPIGYSDHTTELPAGALAVAAGAVIIEKHLTHDRSASGPDHAASADPKQFEQYVQLIRHAELMRGTGIKRVLDCEQDVRQVSRQSLVIRNDLLAGQTISKADLTVQRPGAGVPASDAPQVVGKILRANVQAGTMLTWELLDDAA